MIPNVLQMNSSLLVTDPKGTLERVVTAQGCHLRGARGIPRRGTETRGRDGLGREPETQTTVWSMGGEAPVAVLAVASALSILAAVGAQDGLLAALPFCFHNEEVEWMQSHLSPSRRAILSK
ncbi:hypothetical protein [Tractidigestivibacter sp.]|uniref:hypothetical protein n=1 Tax=Tractidigestivibacter sp. TaxID=2847320 RepID=UPI003D91BC8E